MTYRIACSLPLLASLAVCSPVVRAAPVVFDNSARGFVWRSSSYYYMPPFTPGGGLHVTRAPAEQPAPPTVLDLPGLTGHFFGSPNTGQHYKLDGVAGTKIASEFFANAFAAGYDKARPLSATDEVGPSMRFESSAYLRDTHRLISFPPHGYIGLSFPLADGTHYGFVELDATALPAPQPLRWGYESTPGVAFLMSSVVPEPAAAGVLAVAGCLLVQRRRGLGSRTKSTMDTR